MQALGLKPISRIKSPSAARRATRRPAMQVIAVGFMNQKYFLIISQQFQLMACQTLERMHIR